VLELSAHGTTAQEVAASLRLSRDEVHEHLAAAIRSLGAQSKLEAILFALRRSLIEPLAK
jgi:DNA-binding NarL/FixJ family response regulator